MTAENTTRWYIDTHAPVAGVLRTPPLAKGYVPYATWRDPDVLKVNRGHESN